MAFAFVFCVHVTPSILRAVGRVVRVRVLVDVSASCPVHVSSQICELVNKITFDTHLQFIR